MNTAGVRKRTIKDFGNQWKIHGKIDEDYWSSDQYFRDYFKNHFNPKVLKNKVVGDIGSGSGRIIQMLSKYKLKRIYAVEPSIAGVKKIKKNTEIDPYWNYLFTKYSFLNTRVYYIRKKRIHGSSKFNIFTFLKVVCSVCFLQKE